jgi:hypothetical protein
MLEFGGLVKMKGDGLQYVDLGVGLEISKARRLSFKGASF